MIYLDFLVGFCISDHFRLFSPLEPEFFACRKMTDNKLAGSKRDRDGDEKGNADGKPAKRAKIKVGGKWVKADRAPRPRQSNDEKMNGWRALTLRAFNSAYTPDWDSFVRDVGDMSSEKFNTYYKVRKIIFGALSLSAALQEMGIVPEGEWDTFIAVLRSELPTTFRCSS